MRRVLVIAYFYPPYSGVGATRLSKTTKYLADFGWESHVLTVDQLDAPPTLAVEIPGNRIVRVPQAFDITALPRALLGRRRLTSDRMVPATGWRAALLEKSSWAYRHLVCFPDPQIGWRSTAVAAGLSAIERIHPDVILSSSFPSTSHLVARSLARKTSLPWVAELRDLWTANHNFRRIQPLRALERRLERRVLSDATSLVTVSDTLADWLRAEHRQPTFVVPNGFDPADYPVSTSLSRDVFSLVYTGMFYAGLQDVDPLFRAVARLAAAGHIRPERFRIEFVGQGLGPLFARAETLGVQAFVRASAPVAYRESLRMQCEATALLVLELNSEHGHGITPVKAFEYLGAGRPVLSLGMPDSAVGRLLASSQAGRVASNVDEVERVLRDWLEEFDRTGTVEYVADQTVRHRYERREGARQMAQILADAVERGRVN